MQSLFLFFFFVSATAKLFRSRGLCWDRVPPGPTESRGAERKFARAGGLEHSVGGGLNVVCRNSRVVSRLLISCSHVSEKRTLNLNDAA